MNWHNYLRVKTRQPAFLWRMVLGIIATGIILGVVVGYFTEASRTGEVRIVTQDDRWEAIAQLAEAGHWWQVWWEVPRVIYSDVSQMSLVALAVFAGCCWLAFLLHALRVKGVVDERLWFALIGVGLGVLSIWPTGFLILWQKYHWGLTESTQLAPGLRFFILGVGLREELAKLCCFLPLVPLLVRKRDDLTALIAASCVGLGFAIEENIGYYQGSLATGAMGRFLTANPAHIALTGIIGLAVYRAACDVENWGPVSLAIFGVLVFAHGLYDAVIALPALKEYSLLSIIVFALVLFQYFRELRALRPVGGDTISLSATFLCGVSLLTAATFITISASVGSWVAFNNLATDVMGLAVMVYLFLREMPESMIQV